MTDWRDSDHWTGDEPEKERSEPRRRLTRAAENREREERRLLRLEKQRIRSAKLRATKAAKKIPDRDDIAREMLHYAITSHLRPGREQQLLKLVENVSARLVERGFDAEATLRVFTELIDKYEDGWDFQRKVRLLARRDDDPT